MALKFPLPSPRNTKPPLVDNVPPTSGCGVLYCHCILPVDKLIAESRPHCGSFVGSELVYSVIPFSVFFS